MTTTSHLQRRSALVLCSWLAVGLAIGVGTAAAQAPGTLDPGFGVGGRVLTHLGANDDRVRAVHVLKNGSVLTVGTSTQAHPPGPSTSQDVIVARYRADGQLDSSFGVGGIARKDGGGLVADLGYALARLADGSILAAGSFNDGGVTYSNFGVTKFSRNGVVDSGFGLGGIARSNLAPGNAYHDYATAVAVQSTGKIVLGGVAYALEGGFHYQRFGLVRFHANGALDTGFGNAGQLILGSPHAGGADYLTAIARLPDGSLPADNSLTVVGHTHARNTAIVARYSADGQPDPSFGNGGRVLFSATVSGGVHSGLSTITAAVLQTDGRLIVVGQGGDRGFAFIRLLSNGALDPSFGTNGRAHVKFTDASQYDEPFAVALQGNGKVAAGGYVSVNLNDFAVVRLLPNGTPDPGFGDGQGRASATMSVQADRAAGIAVAPSGALVLAGYAQMGSGNQAEDFALARFFGDPDRLFWHDFEL